MKYKSNLQKRNTINLIKYSSITVIYSITAVIY